MSVHKEISEHPSKNAVTAPNNPALQKANTAHALQAYGIIQAFREGCYPSNRQIDETLDYALESSPVDRSKLSKEGKMLIQDFQNIIRTAKRMVSIKNEDELFQNFLYNTRHVDTSKANLNAVNTPVGKDDLKNDGQQAVEHLRTLGKLIFTNSEARKLLKDIGILGRDVAADAAAKVAEVARPEEHELNAVDEPAPSNQWVGPDGETRSHNDPVPDTGLAAKKEQLQQKKEEAKQEAQQHAEESQNRVANAADNAQSGHSRDEDKANAAANAGSDQAKEEAQKKKNVLLNKIPDEHKDKAKEQLEKTKEYAKDKFPQERRDRFIYRLKKVVVENQRHRDFQEAVEFFLDRAETYHAHGKDVASQGADQGLNVRNDSAFQEAENQLRTLLERFANNQSMQPIFDSVNQLYTDAKNDRELSEWFSQLDTYIRQVLQEPGYIMRDESDRDGRKLLDQGKRFWDPKEGKYAGHKDAVFDSLADFFKSYADDELNVQLGEDVKKLTKDLLMDADGNLQYKSHLWQDVRSVILPTLAKKVGLIPIPRVEYASDEVEIVLENITLESQNLLPNVFEVEARNYFKVSPYDAIKDVSKHSFWVSFSQIQADIHDVAFYIKKKTGFPKLKDSGIADVVISGKGISGKIHLESTGRKDHAFKIIDVKVTLDKLKFAVKHSKYSFLISTFRPILTGLIKKAVAKGIQEGIRGGLVQLDAQLADIMERYEEAKKADGAGGTIDVIKSVITEKKESAQEQKAKAEENAPSGQFQITGKRDSKLVNWSSKNSAVEQQGEKQELAQQKHHGWKSPAFDIVGKNAANKPRLGGSGAEGGSTSHSASRAVGESGSHGHGATGAAAGAAAGAGTAAAAGHGTSHYNVNTGPAATLHPHDGSHPTVGSMGATSGQAGGAPDAQGRVHPSTLPPTEPVHIGV